MLLLHLGDLLGVLLVHLLELHHHPLTALTQRLLVIDQLRREGEEMEKTGREEKKGMIV